MKIEINSNIFNDFVKNSKIISDNFGGMLIDATDGKIELVKCDIDNQIIREVQGNIYEAGKVILPKEILPLIKQDSIMTIFKDKIILGFNCNYLIDCVKNMNGNFTMKFTNEVNPLIVESSNKYELILPVRVTKI